MKEGSVVELTDMGKTKLHKSEFGLSETFKIQNKKILK